MSCREEIETTSVRGKYCSDKCRVTFNRNKQNSTTVNVTIKAEIRTAKHPAESTVTSQELTATDKDFQDNAVKRGLGADWLIFSNLKQVKCLQCNKSFETSLELLRYCSVKCR